MPTPTYSLPSLVASTSEREAFNELALFTDTVTGRASVAAVNSLVLPSSPSAGALVLLGSPTTGLAAGFDGALAYYNGLSWTFVPSSPTMGPIAAVDDFYVPTVGLDGWEPFVPSSSIAFSSTLSSNPFQSERRVLTAPVTSLLASAPLRQVLDPDGASRTVVLPPPAINMAFDIICVGFEGDLIDIETNSGTLLITLENNGNNNNRVQGFYDGTVWILESSSVFVAFE
jgi:hypothetical protein